MKRLDALLKQTKPKLRYEYLIEQGATSTRRAALMRTGGAAPRIPVPYFNKKGRQFFLTLKGVYVIRHNGKSLYGRKAYKNNQGVIKNLSGVPVKIRPAHIRK